MVKSNRRNNMELEGFSRVTHLLGVYGRRKETVTHLANTTTMPTRCSPRRASAQPRWQYDRLCVR